MTELTVRRPPIATVRPSTSIPSRIVTLVAVLVPPLGVLAAMGLLWEVAVRPVDVIMLVALYTLCGLGITVGFHRLFSHRAFKAHPSVRAALAILGSMTIQGPVTQWVTDHRKHHALSDREGDPHSPHGRDGLFGGLSGFLHAHMGWLVTTKGMERGRRYGRDLYDDPLIRRSTASTCCGWSCRWGSRSRSGYAVDPTWRGRPDGDGVGRPGADLPVPPHDVERELRVPHVRPPALRDRGREPQQLGRGAARRSARAGTTTTTPSPARRSTAWAAARWT